MKTVDIAHFVRANAEPARYPVNLRFTIPLPTPFFVTFIVGREKRGRERLRAERSRHPLNTWGNLSTLVVAWAIFSTATLFAAFIAAAL